VTAENLAQRQCVPCRGDVPPLTDTEIAPLLEKLSPHWSVEQRDDPKHRYVKVLMRQYRFANFAAALHAARAGASVLRVHDVRATRQAIDLERVLAAHVASAPAIALAPASAAPAIAPAHASAKGGA